MIRSLVLIILLANSPAFAQGAVVPIIGCAADGMSGHEPAPASGTRQLPISGRAAAHLAYYSDSGGLGILAPRNWHCFEIYGSDGAFLVVSPQPVSADTIYKMRRLSPVVVMSFVLGFTSGRDEIAPVINRVFPNHRNFVRDVAANNDQPLPRYKGPFSGDRLHYLSSEALEYRTLSHHDGLGTIGFLRPSSVAISGLEMLVKDHGDCCDLISLAIRLDPVDATLAPVIVRQAERDESHPRSSVPADPPEPPAR